MPWQNEGLLPSILISLEIGKLLLPLFFSIGFLPSPLRSGENLPRVYSGFVVFRCLLKMAFLSAAAFLSFATRLETSCRRRLPSTNTFFHGIYKKIITESWGIEVSQGSFFLLCCMLVTIFVAKEVPLSSIPGKDEQKAEFLDIFRSIKNLPPGMPSVLLITGLTWVSFRIGESIKRMTKTSSHLTKMEIVERRQIC